MKCVVTFKIGEEEITLDLETDQESALTDQEIIKVLQENEEKRDWLCDTIHNTLYNQSKLSETTVETLLKKEGLLGNCRLSYLMEQFPQLDWPEGVDANILLINNLRIGKNENMYGRIINSNGKELFIVKGTIEDVAKLAAFLRVRQQLEEQAFNFSEESPYYKNLQKIKTLRNRKKNPVDNIFDLMLDFNYNKAAYEGKDMYITNEDGTKESSYSILQNLNNIIMQYSGRIEYADSFVNTINQHIKYFKDDRKVISLKSLYGAMEAYHKELLKELEIKNQTSFHNFFSQNASQIQEQLKKVFDEVVEGKEGYATLLTNLFKAEPEFPIVFDHSSTKSIWLKSIPRTLQAKYGIAYDTISSYDIITGTNNYKGYKIYAFWNGEKRKFIPSRGYLTEDSISKIYNSEEEVRQYINSSVEKQDIKKNSFIDFKFRNSATIDGETVWEDELSSLTVYSRQSLTQGSIIESLDIPINKKTDLYNGEDELFKLDRQNYSSFKERVNKWGISEETKNYILDNINNPEKIAVFIYKVNEQLQDLRTDNEAMVRIVDMINNAGVRSYYIDRRIWKPEKGRYQYRVIPTDGIVIEQYKKDKRMPIITLMNKVKEVLSSKFNVPVNMMIAREIQQEFPDIDVNTAKAFIRNGQIYINTTIAQSSDLLHEYTHLILGVLKTDPNLRTNYEQLLGIIASTKQGENMMKKLYESYEGISQMDLMEEVFVKLFSGHIMGNLNPEVKEIFQGQEKFLKDATKIIFNNGVDNLQSFYGKSLESVFSRFSSDISVLLQQDGLNFESTKTSRLYSDWISKQVKKYKDTEGEEGIYEECL